MSAKKLAYYKVKNLRNINPRAPVSHGQNIIVPFIYDKGEESFSRILCLDDDLNILWQYDDSETLISILVHNDQLLRFTMFGQVQLIDISSGTLKSTIDLPLSTNGPTSNVWDDKVVIGGIGREKKTLCFDLNTLKVVWEYVNGGHWYRALIHEGFVYQTHDNHIKCIDVSTGELKWATHNPKSYLFAPTVSEDIVYSGGNGCISAFLVQDGKLVGELSTGIKGAVQKISIEDDLLLFGDNEWGFEKSSGSFHAYKIQRTPAKLPFRKERLSFHKKWELETSGGIESVPRIGEDYIYFANNDARLFKLNKGTGEPVWEQNIKGNAGISAPLFKGNSLFVNTEKGHIFKFKDT